MWDTTHLCVLHGRWKDSSDTVKYQNKNQQTMGETEVFKS